MIEEFRKLVLRYLLAEDRVHYHLKRNGANFDEHVANELLGRGLLPCNRKLEGLLYANKYAPMHYAALQGVIPRRSLTEGGSTLLVDIGAGPGTALMAGCSFGWKSIIYVALESAAGMMAPLGMAVRLASGCVRSVYVGPNITPAFEMAAIRAGAEAQRVFIVLSYFLAQRLTRSTVSKIGRLITSLSKVNGHVTIVYTNPVGPSAAWMPYRNVHYWYRQLCNMVGRKARIRQREYNYSTVANLSRIVQRSGKVAFEVWSP